MPLCHPRSMHKRPYVGLDDLGNDSIDWTPRFLSGYLGVWPCFTYSVWRRVQSRRTAMRMDRAVSAPTPRETPKTIVFHRWSCVFDSDWSISIDEHCWWWQPKRSNSHWLRISKRPKWVNRWIYIEYCYSPNSNPNLFRKVPEGLNWFAWKY